MSFLSENLLRARSNTSSSARELPISVRASPQASAARFAITGETCPDLGRGPKAYRKPCNSGCACRMKASADDGVARVRQKSAWADTPEARETDLRKSR